MERALSSLLASHGEQIPETQVQLEFQAGAVA